MWLQCLGSPGEPAGSPGAVARGDCELGHGASGRQVRDLNHRAIAPVPIPWFSKRCVTTPMWGCKAECGRAVYGKFGNDERFLNVQQMNSPVVLAWAAACAFPAAWAPNTQHPHLALIMQSLHTHQHMLPRRLSSAMRLSHAMNGAISTLMEIQQFLRCIKTVHLCIALYLNIYFKKFLLECVSWVLF